jgi:hypothetical protein
MAMVPAPLPDLPLGRDNHPALVFTVHEQFACVVSDAVSRPPARHGAKVTGATAYSQFDGSGVPSPACVTENVWPAIVKVPDRETVALFALTA